MFNTYEGKRNKKCIWPNPGQEKNKKRKVDYPSKLETKIISHIQTKSNNDKKEKILIKIPE